MSLQREPILSASEKAYLKSGNRAYGGEAKIRNVGIGRHVKDYTK